MCEMLHLGFNGKYNLRLGETLLLACSYVDAIEKSGNIINYGMLQNKLSNAYTMYCLENSTVLAGIVNMCTISNCFCIGGYTDVEFRKKVIDNMKYEQYVVSFEMFSFLSEGLWPHIVESFFRGLKIGKDKIVIRLIIPVNKVKKYTNEFDITKSIKKFCDEFAKWLEFHMIGKIVFIGDENDNLEIGFCISY